MHGPSTIKGLLWRSVFLLSLSLSVSLFLGLSLKKMELGDISWPAAGGRTISYLYGLSNVDVDMYTSIYIYIYTYTYTYTYMYMYMYMYAYSYADCACVCVHVCFLTSACFYV